MIARRLVVFADDWGRHPSSAQHLVKPLLQSRAVTWINTIGTRTVQLDAALLRRGVQKLRQWSGQRDPSPEPEGAGSRPDILNPAMYPGFRNRFQRHLNAALLGRAMEKHLPDLGDAVVLSTIPIVADLPARVRAWRWVYYCVDDFSAWPGLDSGPLAAMEAAFVQRADRLVAAGDNLAGRLQAMGRTPEVISHGIELEHWRAPVSPSARLREVQGPVVLFWGLIDRRLDPAFLDALSRRLEGGTIVLAGPEQNPDPVLDTLSRVRRIGPVPYGELPALAAGAAVLVMPYADLPVTRAMQPLKLKEYLACGLPVVCSALPAVAAWKDCLDVVDSADQFAERVVMRLLTGLDAQQRVARQRLAGESWVAKSQRLERILFEE